jgi:hypothetical protein
MTTRKMRCKHSDPLCDDCKRELDNMSTDNKENEELQNSISRLLGDYRAWVNRVPSDDQAKDSIETRDAIMQLIKSRDQQIALAARKSERKMHERESAFLRAFQESVIKAEQLKVEPKHICAGCFKDLDGATLNNPRRRNKP